MIPPLIGGDVAVSPTVEQWLRHLTSRGTSVEAPAPAGAAPLPDPAWAALWERVLGGRITWSLLDAVGSGDLPATEGQRGLAEEAHLHAMGLCLRLDGALLAATGALGAAGVDHRVLKGPVVARLDHVAVESRQYGDIDLLVHDADLGAALTALDRAGWPRKVPSMGEPVDARLVKGVTLRSAGGLEVDLHRSIAPGGFAVRLRSDRLWDDPSPVPIGDRTVTGLPPAARLAHTAAHLRLGNSLPYLSTARDLLVQLDRNHPDDAAPVTDGLGLTAVLVAAIAQLAESGLTVPMAWQRWARTVDVDPDERRLVERHLATDGAFGGLSAEGLAALPWRDRPGALRSLVLPSADHLAARGTTRTRHLRRVLRSGLHQLSAARRDRANPSASGDSHSGGDGN